MQSIKIVIPVLLLTSLGSINAAKIGDGCIRSVGSRYCPKNPLSDEPFLVCKPKKGASGTCVECMQDVDCRPYSGRSACNSSTNTCIACPNDDWCVQKYGGGTDLKFKCRHDIGQCVCVTCPPGKAKKDIKNKGFLKTFDKCFDLKKNDIARSTGVVIGALATIALCLRVGIVGAAASEALSFEFFFGVLVACGFTGAIAGKAAVAAVECLYEAAVETI